MTKLWLFSIDEKAVGMLQFRMLYSLIGKLMECTFKKQILAIQELRFITGFIVCVF